MPFDDAARLPLEFVATVQRTRGACTAPFICSQAFSEKHSTLITINNARCRDPGSNRGPSDLQSDALPTELSRLDVSTLR